MTKKALSLLLAGSFSLCLLAACNSTLTGGLSGTQNTQSTTPDSNSTAHAIFPDAVSLDISEMPDDSGSTDNSNGDLQNGGDQGQDHGARACSDVIYGFHEITDRVLALAAQIRKDITDPNQTQVSGTLQVGHKQVPYKADFAAFDFDGDGTPDGSGHAGVAPVAVRLWVDSGNGYQQLLCALVTTLPSSSNIGAGAFYVKPSAINADAASNLQLFVKYDRTDATHKWNEAFVTGIIRPKFSISASDARVDIRSYSDNHIEKTIRTTTNFSSDPFGFTNFASAEHWAQGSRDALVSGMSTGGTSQISFSNVCVNIRDRHLAASSNCASFDTQDMTFLAQPTGNETTFPTDFPTSPTF